MQMCVYPSCCNAKEICRGREQVREFSHQGVFLFIFFTGFVPFELEKFPFKTFKFAPRKLLSSWRAMLRGGNLFLDWLCPLSATYDVTRPRPRDSNQREQRMDCDVTMPGEKAWVSEVSGYRSYMMCDENSLHTLEAPFIEMLNVKLCKYVLGVSHKSCNDAVRGELGRYPLLLMTINQWFKYAKHCYSLPCDNFTRASLSGLCDYTTCSPYRNWSPKYMMS